MTGGYATNSQVKKNNRNRIFRYICRHEKVSNPEISYEFKMSLPTVMQNTKELIEQGLVREVGELESTGGRKAKALSVVADSRLAIGLDITKNHIGLVLTNLTGEILRYTRIQQKFEDCEAYYCHVNDRIESFIKESGADKTKILGLGISIPGILDLNKNVIIIAYVLNLVSKPLASISRYFSYPCIFLNDANAGAYAEGVRAGRDDRFFYVSLSNTVGGAIFHNGELIQGGNFRCGEVGHMTIVLDGKECYCGKRGCLDAYCSAERLASAAEGKLEIFFRRLKEGDKEAADIWEQYTSSLAVAINNIYMMLDCDVVLGGYVGGYIEGRHLQDVCDKVSKRNTFATDSTYVRPCCYRTEAAALGAALQIIEEFVKQV